MAEQSGTERWEIAVLAASEADEERWVRELRAAMARAPGAEGVSARAAGGREPGALVLVDGASSAAMARAARIDRRGRAVFVIVREGEPAPRALLEGAIDGALVHPFRPLEVLGLLRHHRQLRMWDEVRTLNDSFAGMVERLREDVSLAERLQKSKLPVRFPELKGLRAQSRYLAGIRSGGDHFDLAESQDGQRLTFVLTDSSTYGLSSAVLGALMRVTLKLTADEARSSLETVRRIQADLAATLGQRDRLSLFYGVLDRREYLLRYLSLGTVGAFHAPAGGRFRALPREGEPITAASTLDGAREQELRLEPQDRFALFSDGFIDAAGGEAGLIELLDRFRGADPVDALNELAYRVKSKFTEPDDMPEQDCSALVVDVDSRVIRLAPGAK